MSLRYSWRYICCVTAVGIVDEALPRHSAPASPPNRPADGRGGRVRVVAGEKSKPRLMGEPWLGGGIDGGD